MKILGIDPSINSTGICALDTCTKQQKYYIIASKMTRKMTAFENEYVTFLPYEKTTNEKGAEYIEKEQAKTNNIYAICDHIENLITEYKPEYVSLEGISYGSVGSAALADLAGLNFAIRMVCKLHNIPILVVPPTQVKKYAVGNGGANKEVMIASWKLCDPNISNIKEIKIDDLADSYFIAHYGVSVIGDGN